MITRFKAKDHHFVEVTDRDSNALGETVWADLLAPSAAEGRAVIERYGEVLPRDAEAGEIEATSLYYEDEGAIQVQLSFLFHTSSQRAEDEESNASDSSPTFG